MLNPAFLNPAFLSFFDLASVNKLVSLTWLLWALRNFRRFTLHSPPILDCNLRQSIVVTADYANEWLIKSCGIGYHYSPALSELSRLCFSMCFSSTSTFTCI